MTAGLTSAVLDHSASVVLPLPTVATAVAVMFFRPPSGAYAPETRRDLIDPSAQRRGAAGRSPTHSFER